MTKNLINPTKLRKPYANKRKSEIFNPVLSIVFQMQVKIA